MMTDTRLIQLSLGQAAQKKTVRRSSPACLVYDTAMGEQMSAQ